MNPIQRTALALLLALPLAAGAKTTPNSGHAYSGGFSSGKSSTSRAASPAPHSYNSFGGSKPAASPAPAASEPPATTKAGPGGFSSREVPSPTGPKSALSTGLDKNAAEANALKSLDARNARKEATANPPPVSADNQFGNSARPAQTSLPPAYAPAPQYAPQPQSPSYQNSGSGFSLNSGIIGFMLGRAMSGNHHSGGYASGYPSTHPSGSVAGDAPHAGSSGFGMGLLRIILWMLVLGALGGLVWFFFFRKKPADPATTAHYRL